MTAPTEGQGADELGELLDLIYRDHHYDFRRYSRSSLERGVARARETLGVAGILELIGVVESDPAAFSELLRHLTIQTSDFFRDPAVFRALRDDVLPHLATWPFPRIWIAGCGTGEEVCSIAILLDEAGLLERSMIYATDIDPESLRIARSGAYELRRVAGFAENHARAGGRRQLEDYYVVSGSQALFDPRLRERVTFSDHSLATDAAFAEVHLVSARNVLIYFGRELHDHAIGLFRESLCHRGFLLLGAHESLALSSHAAAFAPFSHQHRIYRAR